MIEKKFLITHDLGLHAKYATLLVQKCNQFNAKITLTCKKLTADFKSIMGVMALGVSKADVIVIDADGYDEEEAIKQISLELTDNMIAKEI